MEAVAGGVTWMAACRPEGMSMILGVHPVRNGLVIGAGLLTTWLFRRFRPLSRWRLSSLTSHSQRLYKREQYDEALAMARTAQQLAKSHFGKASTQYQRALFHLAAVHSAMRRNDDALEVLKECNQLVRTLHGDASLQRVPICHAMAEVHEAEGGSGGMKKAAAVLQEARELRRAALGEANLSYAFSCIQEAALLVRFANDALMMDNGERGRLADQAVGLALTAHAAAGESARPTRV